MPEEISKPHICKWCHSNIESEEELKSLLMRIKRSEKAGLKLKKDDDDDIQFHQFSSVTQSCPTQWLHEPQHARPPYPLPTLRVHPNLCPSSRWHYPVFSSSVVPFSSCPQSLPASGSFPVSQLFASGGQRVGVSASTSVLPMNTQDWSSLGWTGWISLQSKGLSRVLFNTTVQKHHIYYLVASHLNCGTQGHMGSFFAVQRR